jgi:hypothetical protein
MFTISCLLNLLGGGVDLLILLTRCKLLLEQFEHAVIKQLMLAPQHGAEHHFPA